MNLAEEDVEADMDMVVVVVVVGSSQRKESLEESLKGVAMEETLKSAATGETLKGEFMVVILIGVAMGDLVALSAEAVVVISALVKLMMEIALLAGHMSAIVEQDAGKLFFYYIYI